MEIQCPICPILIEVSNEHIGSKGRCPNCESKFIIPEDPDDEVEILHRGEIPESTPRRKVSVVMSGQGNAPQRTAAAKMQMQAQKPSSPVGMIAFGAVCVTAAVIFAIVKSGENKPTSESAQSINSILDDHPEAARTAPLFPDPHPVTADTEPSSAIASNEEMTSLPELVGETSEPEPPTTEELPPALTEEQKRSALTFIKSKEPKKRAAAYAGFRKRGDREKSIYLEVLTEAAQFHSEFISEHAYKLSQEDPLAKFRTDFDAWAIARDEAKQLVQTNWKDRDPSGYKKSHTEMDEATEKAILLFKNATRGAEHVAKFSPSEFQEAADALTEIRIEIAYCQDRVADDPMSLVEEIAKSGGADDYVKSIEQAEAANRIVAELDAAESHNAGSGWAGGAYKNFATTLNERRVALGLNPLRLDEMLSKACEAHSADMAANNYFSHTGLTPETKSFGQRAKRAGFSGFATGECIFMGNPSPLAAHKAWWYSDGHRLIMYANHPNTLGLGLHGKHWTLNTGKK